MSQISASYASPNIRWALLLEDHPGARHEFREGTTAEVGVPAAFGGDQPIVICTIHFPAGAGMEPAVGWKEVVDSKGKPVPQSDWNPALWNQLCTKALGRACKRAGYPDDLAELKALVLWRQRTAEVAAISSGRALAELGAGEQVEKALEAAGVADPEHAEDPDEQVPEGVDPETGEIVEPEAVIAEEEMAALRALVGSLGKRQSAATKWAKDQGFNWPRSLTPEEADRFEAKIREIAAESEAA